MRNYISALYSGNLFPHQEVINFLSNEGNVLPTKYISMNSYKEHRGLVSFAFENARNGSNLTIVARNLFPFPVHAVVYYLLRNYARAFLPSIMRIPQIHNTHYDIENSQNL